MPVKYIAKGTLIIDDFYLDLLGNKNVGIVYHIDYQEQTAKICWQKEPKISPYEKRNGQSLKEFYTRFRYTIYNGKE